MWYLFRYAVSLTVGFIMSFGTLAARERGLQADTTVVRGAELRLSMTVCDFGDVPRRGGDLSCEIAFTNTGDAPLVVSRLITSSSCLRASCSRRPVAPGDSGVIRIVYQLSKRSGCIQSGYSDRFERCRGRDADYRARQFVRCAGARAETFRIWKDESENQVINTTAGSENGRFDTIKAYDSET